jgi:hypothetical protein
VLLWQFQSLASVRLVRADLLLWVPKKALPPEVVVEEVESTQEDPFVSHQTAWGVQRHEVAGSMIDEDLLSTCRMTVDWEW